MQKVNGVIFSLGDCKIVTYDNIMGIFFFEIGLMYIYIRILCNSIRCTCKGKIKSIVYHPTQEFHQPVNPLMYSAFAIELSDLSKPFKFARLKGFDRLENCLTKGTYERF